MGRTVKRMARDVKHKPARSLIVAFKHNDEDKKEMTSLEDLLPDDAPEIHVRLVRTWLDCQAQQIPHLSKFDIKYWAPEGHECFLVHRISGEGEPLELRFGETTKLSFIDDCRDASGKLLTDVLSAQLLDRAESAFLNCLLRNEPYYSEHISSQFGRNHAHFKRLSLPLVDDTRLTNTVFGSIVQIA